MIDLDKQAEHEAEERWEFRKALGMAMEGYAHIHVVKPLDATPVVHVVLPGGSMMAVPGHGDELTQRRLGDFIVAALNAQLSPLPVRRVTLK